MTFVRVKIGEFEVMANADCYVALLLDWLRQRVGLVLGGGPLQGTLDLCDETGNPRLLWALPERVNTLETLVPRAVYYLVVRATAADSFRLVRPLGRPELLRSVHERLRRAVAAWGRVSAKLAADVTPAQLVESVNQCVTQQASRAAQRRSAAGSVTTKSGNSADKWHKLKDKVEHEIAVDNHLTEHLRGRTPHLKV